MIPCSVSDISVIPVNAFTTRKSKYYARINYAGNPSIQSLPSQRYFLTLPQNSIVFPRLINACVPHRTSSRLLATGTDLTVEDVTDETPAVPAEEAETKEDLSPKSDVSSPPQFRRRPGRKSEMPPVKSEDLVPGATFTGKVRSIQPFGAFIDFGAFTDGLVHVSRLSENFVKDVNDVVSLGQEVKVKLVEVNTETGRISLSMREGEGTNRPQQKSDSSDKTRAPRKNANKPAQKREDFKKTSKFVKGQDLVGTVKNLVRSGAFISLPEDEEGFLPTSEEPDDGFGNVMGNTTLEAGQEVKVRVLRISRGIVTLTMKTEEDVQKLDSELNQGVVHTATNPFVVAFRRNKDVATFLDEREKNEEPSDVTSEETEETVEPSESPKTAQVQGEQESGDDIIASADDSVDDTVKEQDELLTTATVVETITEKDESAEIPNNDGSGESSVAEISEGLQAVATIPEEEATAISEVTESELTPVADDSVSEISSDNIETEEEVIAGQIDSRVAKDEVTTPTSEEVVAQTEDVSSKEDVTEEIPPNNATLETSTPESNGNISGSNESSTQGSASKAAISPTLVKQLREETGAGMMDCKKALSETGGDIVKAQEYLRKKGLASADKKSSRTTAEGRIGSYIHDSRIGVLIEVNCETDFVSRGDIFQELVDDLAMQVAACPQVEYLSTEDVPKEIVDKETELEMQKEDLLSKPEQFRAKIVEGRVNKRLGDLALLEQPYIKNDKVAVKEWVKQTIATIGENIKVRRFVRYNLGEGLQKRSQDFAAEVAAQTAAKPAPTSEKEQPAPVGVEKQVEKAPSMAISAALVKQLREETGAGMMDCKKALSETGGDIEKAQEYLRKKGLSSAEKKSSRLAAEGRIGSYVHDARIGVLIEVNCETDFVGRSENFKEFADDLAMQVAACPQVQYVSIEDIPESIVSKEREIEMQREDILSKPENIREKIVDGRISKRLGELALLEQPYIKNDTILVKDLVKQTVAVLGENVKVRRFARFTLGEQPETTNVESETTP